MRKNIKKIEIRKMVQLQEYLLELIKDNFVADVTTINENQIYVVFSDEKFSLKIEN